MAENVIDIIVNAAKARTDVAALDTGMSGIGKAAAAAGEAATAGLSGVERATESAKASTLSAGQALRNYQQEIVTVRGEMAELNRQIVESTKNTGANSIATRELKTAYGEQSAALRVLLAEKAQVVIDARQEAVAQREAAFAAKEQAAAAAQSAKATAEEAAAAVAAAKALEEKAAADLAAAEAAGLNARQMIVTAGAASRVAGVAIPGARALGTLAGAFSAASIGQLALVVGAGILIGELFKLGKATQEVVKIDGDWVAITAFAADNGNLIVQATHAQSQSAAALTGDIERVVTNQQKLNEENDRGAAIQKKLETATQEAQHSMTVGTVGYGAALTRTSESADTYRKLLIGSSDQQSKFTKEVAEGLKGLDAYRAITHQGSDAVVEFARQQKYTNEQLEALRQALNEDVRKMGEFADQAAKAALHTRSLAEATIAFNSARATASGPGFSNSQFATAADTAKFAAEIATNLQAAQQQGATFREAVIGQSSALRELQQHLRETTLTQKGYHEEIKQLPEATAKAIVELEKIQKGMKVFADHTKQAESAAKALSLATADLAAKLESAQAARDEAAGVTTSFDQQRANIRTAIDLKRHELEEKHQLTVLNNVNLSALESAQIATVQAKWVEANRLLQERLGEIEAKASAKAADDKVGLLRAEISKRYDVEADYAKRAGFTEKEQAEYLVDVRVALIKEYLGRRSKLEDDGRKHELQEESKLQNTLEDERLKADKRTMDEGIKRFKDLEGARHLIAGQVGGSFVHPADEAAVIRLKHQIDQLTVSEKGLNNEEAKVRAVFQQVATVFGVVSRDTGTLKKQIDFLNTSLRHSGWDEFRLRMQLASEETEKSMTTAQRWQQVVMNGVNQMGANIENAFASIVTGQESFGQAMKALTFDLIGSLAQQWGAYYIGKGIADIFLDPPLGAAELAGGAALMALAGVMKGLAGAGGGANKGTSGAGAASGGAASSTAPTRVQQPTFINVPSGQQQSANALAGMTLRSPRQGTEIQVTLVNKLDANGTSQFLNGQNVVTRHNVASHRKEIRRGLGLAPA